METTGKLLQRNPLLEHVIDKLKLQRQPADDGEYYTGNRQAKKKN